MKISNPFKNVSSWKTWPLVRVKKSSNTFANCSNWSCAGTREVADEIGKAMVLTSEIGMEWVKTIENESTSSSTSCKKGSSCREDV